MIMNKKNGDLSRKHNVSYLMTSNIPTVHEAETTDAVKDLISRKSKKFDSINYIYVLDSYDHLVGVVSIKELLRAKSKIKISQIMTRDIASLKPHSHRKTAAALAIKFNIKEVPIVDKDGIFLGTISNDTVMEILHEEHVETMLRVAGIQPFSEANDIIEASPSTHIIKRVPWLIFGLFGGILAASIIDIFEQTIKSEVLLAAFVPLIVYMADAVGVQTQTLYIRSIAINSKLDQYKYILRESKVAVWLALIVGTIATIVSAVLFGTYNFSMVLGISIMFTMLIAMAVAIFMPWMFTKLRIDPAIASGPFATIIRDVTSLIFYLLIAQVFIKII